MKAPNYEASWVPGLDRKVDRDKSLALGFRWLESAESQHDTPGVVVLHAKRMIPTTPLLAQAATRWSFVSPRSRRPRAQGPGLAIWPPNDRVLELAEDLADGSALCVISGHLLDVAPWVRRTGAQCLMDGFCVAGGPAFRRRSPRAWTECCSSADTTASWTRARRRMRSSVFARSPRDPTHRPARRSRTTCVRVAQRMRGVSFGQQSGMERSSRGAAISTVGDT